MVERSDERTFADAHPVDLQRAVRGDRRRPPRRSQRRRHVYSHVTAPATSPVTPIECVAADADDTVCMLGFHMCFGNDSDRRTVAFEVSGKMLNGARLRHCGGIEDVDGRCIEWRRTFRWYLMSNNVNQFSRATGC
jgi:hypothetical protein